MAVIYTGAPVSPNWVSSVRLCCTADDYDVWAWEPNPKHEKGWRALEARHPTLCYIGKAIFTQESILPLFLDQAKSAQKGTGIVRKEYGGMHSDKSKVNVRTEDIHSWIMAHTSEQDHIIAKMDIEGAEFPVLQKMLVNGSACRLKKLFIEFHSRLDPLAGAAQQKKSNRDPTMHQMVIMEMFKACPTPVEVQIVE